MTTTTRQFHAAGYAWRLTYADGYVNVQRWEENDWRYTPPGMQPAAIQRHASDLRREVEWAGARGEGESK